MHRKKRKEAVGGVPFVKYLSLESGVDVTQRSHGER